MKKILFIGLSILISFTVAAQGNSNKKDKSGKNKESVSKEKKNKDFSKNDQANDDKIWEGVNVGNSCGKLSKNQPAKVRAAFQRDYPNARNVTWTKCRGDWTATFNGAFRSTAIYHANGQRRDTRTVVGRENIPAIILDEILKRRPGTRLEEAIKIEIPNVLKNIFRIKNILGGNVVFEYYNADGVKVNYDY